MPDAALRLLRLQQPLWLYAAAAADLGAAGIHLELCMRPSLLSDRLVRTGHLRGGTDASVPAQRGIYQRRAGRYRNSTLHGLLPLADGFVVGRNIAFLLLLAASTAYLQQRQHRKVKRFPFWCIATALGVVRLLPVDYSTSSSGGVIAAVAALFFTAIFVMLALAQAHDGTEGLADELD